MDAKSFRKQLRRNQASAETAFWLQVRANKFLNLKFRRQHTIDRYTIDFYCAEIKLIVELDGSSHHNIGKSLYDEERDTFLRAKGYKVIRLDNNAVLKYPEVAMEYIREFIESEKLLR
ncbi:MAG: endonuclease domain-containing protein [Pedobacter sp.]